jgi:uncharacterized RDD family membrane protein YckC
MLSATATEERVYAGLLPRSMAYLIDCAVAFGFFAATQLLLLVPARGAMGIEESWFYSGIHTELYTLLTISLPIWLYFALCEQSKWQATLGKRLLKLRVVDELNYTRIRFPRSLLRTLVKLLPWEIAHLSNNLPKPIWFVPEPEFRAGFMVVCILLFGYVAMVGLSEKKHGPHDRLARTLILKTG